MTTHAIVSNDSLIVGDAVARSESLLKSAQGIAIENQVAYDQVAEFRKIVKKEYLKIEKQRKDMKEPILEAGRRVDDMFRPALEFLKRADKHAEQARIFYFKEQERIRLAEERKLQKEAEERRRELLKKEEEARAAGKDHRADKLKDKVEQTVVHTPGPRVEKTKGASMRKIWKHRVVSESLVPRGFLCVDGKKLSGYATATKGTVPVMGVEFYFEEIEAQRI